MFQCADFYLLLYWSSLSRTFKTLDNNMKSFFESMQIQEEQKVKYVAYKLKYEVYD